MIRNDTTVVTYGGRYPVSLTYYSGYVAKRLKWKDEIPELLPGALDWNAKNMMPFASIESLSEDKDILAVVRSGDLQDLRQILTESGNASMMMECGWSLEKLYDDPIKGIPLSRNPSFVV